MEKGQTATVTDICGGILEELARAFPVSCASDEFFYFPQIKLPDPDWSTWDRFTGDAIAEFVQRLSVWEWELDRLGLSETDPDLQIDSSLYKKLVRTLREQLSEVRTWQTQPTFYLTLVCLGLAEAIEEEDPGAIHERAETVSAFLDEARHNLADVPLLFREMGLKMVVDTRNYLAFLSQAYPELRSSFDALERFNETLLKVPTREDFLLPENLLDRIFRFHLSCEMGIEEVEFTLDQEIREMKKILDKEAGDFSGERMVDQDFLRKWQEVLEDIPMPSLGKGGIVEFYRDEVGRLAAHCLDQGWVSADFVSACPVRVLPMPPYLSAIRSASSYSIPPKHPPSGGVFSVINAHVSNEAYRDNYREFRMLCAHETYPGHHLLDSSRWSMDKSCRRAVEQPLFYEGWACFAEELMKLTGYYTDPGDSMFLAKRRLWHAVRGKVDIGLQTGKMDIPTAAGYLKETGISIERANSSSRRYPLNPGYQQCYTIGLRRFLSLFETYGRGTVKHFVKTVLGEGEIAFADLEKILINTTS